MCNIKILNCLVSSQKSNLPKTRKTQIVDHVGDFFLQFQGLTKSQNTEVQRFQNTVFSINTGGFQVNGIRYAILVMIQVRFFTVKLLLVLVSSPADCCRNCGFIVIAVYQKVHAVTVFLSTFPPRFF